MKNFSLKDHLKHKAYSWPMTVLTYQEKGEMPLSGRDWLYMDGQPVEYQAEQKEHGYLLKVLADLPTGSQHNFEWRTKGQITPCCADLENLDNGIICVKSIDGGLVCVQHTNGAQCIYTLKTEKKIHSVSEALFGGCIEKGITKTILFTDGSKYIFTVKIKKGLDYVEIQEDMSNWIEDGSTLQASLLGFLPRYRYTHKREREKIDDYLREDGRFPFILTPYTDGGRRRDQKGVAYEDEKLGFWFGVLFHDLSACKYQGYAIGYSPECLQFDLYQDGFVAPIAGKTRSFMCIFCSDKPAESLVSLYIKYYSHVSLDKAKDWILEWEDDKNAYPKYYTQTKVQQSPISYQKVCYFDGAGEVEPKDVLAFVDSLDTVFAKLEWINSVGNRLFIYAWVPMFDMTASRMTDEEFRKVRAALAFACYVLCNEDCFPIDTLLAGHPNFLADTLGSVGAIAAILGEKHPMYAKWLAHYEKAVARNLKYHIRPAIEKWGALGGRWTENIGCYMFAALHSTVEVCSLIYHTSGGEMPLLYPHFKELLAFLVNMQSIENQDGRRLYMPHGAHACTGEFGGSFGHGYFATMIQLAELCRNYEPLLAEYLLYNYREQKNFDGVFLDVPQWKTAAYYQHAKNFGGTPPDLYSAKYTGLGFMLRSAVNSEKEMAVFLQQLDDGPNYRWGRAAQGGCGELYYYANKQKYTDHGSEDVGDENKGDVQACTNFGVLVGHEFKCVGRNDLTEPLMNFEFAQYAKVNAGEYSRPYYKYRSVIMVENEYIAIYDAVADYMQYGRFSWAQTQQGEFPAIWNLKPGVQGVETSGGAPIDRNAMFNINNSETKVQTFDGNGDFFTVVSHLPLRNSENCILQPMSTEYGCEILFKDRVDRIFCGQAKTVFECDQFAFQGYVGFLSETSTEIKLSIFHGEYIRCGNVSLKIPHSQNQRYGMSLHWKDGAAFGNANFEDDGEIEIGIPKNNFNVWIDGESAEFIRKNGNYVFVMPKGEHIWNIGLYPKMQKPRIISTNVSKDSVEIAWLPVNGAQEYEIEIKAYQDTEFKKLQKVCETKALIKDLEAQKYFVRITAICETEKSAYSHLYPIYIEDKIPHAPEGFRIEWKNGRYYASWGQVLGCSKYRLYKQAQNSIKIVYEGVRQSICVEAGRYFVSAINANGESQPSLCRSTSDELAHWDNHSELFYIRDTRSAEDGYSGFSFDENERSKILKYER